MPIVAAPARELWLQVQAQGNFGKADIKSAWKTVVGRRSLVLAIR